MFTGLIEKVGQIERLDERGAGARITIAHEPWDSPLRAGESVAVQGVCLTVVQPAAGRFTCDVLSETLARTSFAQRAAGGFVNLERALRVGDPLGGHLVTGHIDGVGTVARIGKAGPDWSVDIACEAELRREIALKGSIACDGVSLTVAGVSEGEFCAHLIPHTWTHTTFCRIRAGDPVNLETDILAKYVRRQLGAEAPRASEVSMETLRRAGFIPPLEE